MPKVKAKGQNLSPELRKEKRVRAKEIDKFVGQQLKTLRKNRKMTLKNFAEHIGVSFQQIQKYESGSNRISAGKLYEFSKILGVDVLVFYEGVSASLQGKESKRQRKQRVEINEYVMGRKDIQDLLDSYYNIGSERVRKQMLALLKAQAAA